MTNAELFDELEDVLRECSEYFPKCDTEIYDVDSAFNKLKKRLTKYKRAFEILKDKLNIKTFISKGLYNENLYVVASVKDGGLITEEESKLLKELLNDD